MAALDDHFHFGLHFLPSASCAVCARGPSIRTSDVPCLKTSLPEPKTSSALKGGVAEAFKGTAVITGNAPSLTNRIQQQRARTAAGRGRRRAAARGPRHGGGGARPWFWATAGSALRPHANGGIEVIAGSFRCSCSALSTPKKNETNLRTRELSMILVINISVILCSKQFDL